MVASAENACFSEIICNKSPNCVEFFKQKEAGPILLGYTWENYVTICVLHLPQLEPDIEEYNYENLTDIDHGSSVLTMKWSPKTSMSIHPVGLIFCTIGIDFQLRLFTLNNKMEVSVKILGEHKSFINDCCFEPSQGNIVASVGDDKKCRMWDVETGEVAMVIPLSSPGRNVLWNINDPTKLVVGEQNGCIRAYNSTTFQPVFTLNSMQSIGNMMSCDWSILNPVKIGAVIGKQWFVWNIQKGSLPESSGTAHHGSSQEFKWSNIHDGIFSTRGRGPDNQFHLYFEHGDQVVISTETKVGTGHSWHNLLPICAVSDDRKILLYDMELLQ